MKKTAIVLLIILLAVGGGLYYLWRQATQLPEWYTGGDRPSDGSVITYGKGVEELKRSLERTVEDQLPKSSFRSGQVEVLLNENDANKLFATILSENAETYRYLQAIKASRTRIKDGELDFGVVVDASEVLRDASEKGDKGIRPQLTRLSGLLQGREVALGFTGKHGFKDGKLQLDEEGKIRIGGLTFSLKTITDRLGISEDKLKRAVKGIELGKLKIDHIQTLRNTLLLKGSVPPS